MEIRTVGVVGLGTMGAVIAQVCVEACARSSSNRIMGSSRRSPRPRTSSQCCTRQIRSTTAAIAWPNPIHMQATP